MLGNKLWVFRAWVLAASQAIASPFAAGVLLLPPPYCFASLLIAYLFAEMWFGVLFAILIEWFQPQCVPSLLPFFSSL
jgi:hypothetical protein